MYTLIIEGKQYFIENLKKVLLVTESKTIKESESGIDFHIGTDGLVMSLPKIADLINDVEYTFTNIGTDGNNVITISPNPEDGIHGTIILGSSVVELSGIIDKDLINTKATSTTGNTVSIQSSSIGWIVKTSTGIWASES